MKKKNFFSGMTYSLAIATFALATVSLTSCEKENFTVEPTDVTVNPSYTLNFDYETLKSYLNSWGIATESSLQKVLTSQLTYDQVKEIVETWGKQNSGNSAAVDYDTLKSFLDTNYKESWSNIKDILDTWNPTFTELKSFLDDWAATKSQIATLDNNLTNFLNSYVALSDAAASISITVYNWDNGELLAQKTQVVAAAEDGKIAAQSVDVECPYVDGYVSAKTIAVEIPALGKGQSINIPITFFVQTVEKNVENGSLEVPAPVTDPTVEAVVTEGPQETTAMSAAEVSPEPIINKVVTIPNYSGQEVSNIEEVNAYIDAIAITRAMSDAAIRSTLKAAVKTLSPGIKKEQVDYTIERINPGYIVNVNVTPEYETVAQSFNYTVDGLEFTIPNILVKRVKANNVVESPVLVNEDYVQKEPTDTDHTGHDSHGDSTNAGGGTAGK